MPTGVYLRTEEHKKKLRGKKSWRDISGLRPHKNGEYKHSVKTLKKMSQSHLGKRKNVGAYSFPKGEKHPSWKGGLTPINHKIRWSFESKLWRKAVFERDSFTCQKYGIRGGDLVAHHINNFAEEEDLRFAIDNGITLSKKAHIEFHKKYGWKNNTKEQLEEFIINH